MKTGIPAIDPGELRHRITVLTQLTVEDASGTGVVWVPSSPPEMEYAKIETVRATDAIKSGQDVAKVWYTITIRYRDGVKPNERRMLPDGNVVIVQGIENLLMMNVYLVLTCLGISQNA